MLKDRKLLETALQNRIVVIGQDKTANGLEYKKEIIKGIYDKYDIPIDLSSDVLTFRKALSEVNILVVFAFTDAILNNLLTTYFTPEEIEIYGNTKYEITKTLDTITFRMIRVADDQWIGSTDVKTMMELRNKQMIHYNGDTQRALQHVIRNGNEILQPYLNHRAVMEISDLYQTDNFIPNTITLNLPEDADYDYNEKTCELTIYGVEYFDITDGYHRYVAMGNAFDNKRDFNYPVELRITKFSTIRAQKFIFQEDHKTKMRRIDSKFMNPNDYGNMIVRKLDEDSNLNGKINNRDGIINAPYLAEVINKLWKPKSNKEVILFAKDIKQKLNAYTEEFIWYLDNEWSRLEIITAFYAFYRDVPTIRIRGIIECVVKKHPDFAKSTIIKKKDIELLEREVDKYVQ